MDPGRIELPPQQCECRVIPLYYRPIKRLLLYWRSSPQSSRESLISPAEEERGDECEKNNRHYYYHDGLLGSVFHKLHCTDSAENFKTPDFLRAPPHEEPRENQRLAAELAVGMEIEIEVFVIRLLAFHGLLGAAQCTGL